MPNDRSIDDIRVRVTILELKLKRKRISVKRRTLLKRELWRAMRELKATERTLLVEYPWRS